MKKLLLPVFVLFGLYASAQNSISLYPYLNLTSTESETFSQFLDSYSAYNSQYITKSPDGTTPGIGFGFGIRAVLGGHLLIPVEWNTLRSSAEFEYTDGSIRHFDLRSNGTFFGMGYAIPAVTNPFYIYPEFGVKIGQEKIKSTFEAGTGNFNPNALNGTFDGFSGKFALGLGGAVGGENFKITARVQYYFPIASSELEDDDKVVSDYGTHVIPCDFPTWAADPVDYYGQTVEDDFKQLNFTLGIVYEIPFDSDDY